MTTILAESAEKLRLTAEERLSLGAGKPDPVDSGTIRKTSLSGEMLRQYHELQVHQIELELQNEELRQTQNELETLKDRYFELYNLAPVGYLTLDEEGRIKEANLAVASMLGVPRSVLLTRPFSQCIHPEDRGAYSQQYRCSLATEGPHSWKLRLLRVNGTTCWVHVSASTANNGEYWMVLNDITKLKQAEEDASVLQRQFQQTQKLESLGVLAGGIAHDFNNILAIITGYCSLAKLDPVNAHNHIPPIEVAVERAADLCRQMLTYAGKAQSVSTLVDMPLLMADMVKMLKTTVNRNVEFKSDFSGNIPLILADISQVRQVVMNLIINASEAIGAKNGHISLSLSQSMFTEELSEIDYSGTTIHPGSYVCLEVADSGCGMDEECRQRIFEPFYTTKSTGRGLGMSAVLGIITTHGGALQLTSTVGQGSAFRVYLPIHVSISAKEESFQRIATPRWQGSGTVLLVDDEEALRAITKTMLVTLGFTVIEASDGREALELYRDSSADIALVLTDLGMPVMDGYELVRELKRIKAEAPIVISSGFGDTEVSSWLSGEKIAGFVSKPYTYQQLQMVLRKALEGFLPLNGGKTEGLIPIPNQ